MFKLTEKYLAYLGLNPDRSIQFGPFNGQNSMTIIAFCSMTTFSLIYIVRVPNTFEEYIVSVYSFASNALSTVAYTIIVLEKSKLFEFINNLNHLVKKSEWFRRLCPGNQIGILTNKSFSFVQDNKFLDRSPFMTKPIGELKNIVELYTFC